MKAEWATLLTGWQMVFFAVIYDICMVASMIGMEVLGHVPTKRREDESDMFAKTKNMSTSVEPAQSGALSPRPLRSRRSPRPSRQRNCRRRLARSWP
jgi:hypothetical protein